LLSTKRKNFFPLRNNITYSIFNELTAKTGCPNHRLPIVPLHHKQSMPRKNIFKSALWKRFSD